MSLQKILLSFTCLLCLSACGAEETRTGVPDNENMGDTPMEMLPDEQVPDSSEPELPVEMPSEDGALDGAFVSSSLPVDGAENVSLVTPVVIQFANSLIPSTVNNENILLMASGGGDAVDVQLQYEEGESQVTLVPVDVLSPLTQYTIRIADSLMDTTGQTSSQQIIFTTVPNLGETTQAVIDSCMSEFDMSMLAAVNNTRIEDQFCSGTGTTQPATHTLRWNCTLEIAAQVHSDDMALNNFFSHTGSDGSNAGSRFTAAGYRWRAWSENIAALGGGDFRDIDRAMNGWMTSDTGHCEGIMSSTVIEFGHAMSESTTADYDSYWTQAFGLPR